MREVHTEFQTSLQIAMDQGSRDPASYKFKDYPRNERVLLSRSWHRNVKTVQRVSVTGLIISCLLYDWDTYLGTDKHVFSGVR